MTSLTRAQTKISLVLADVDGTLVTAEKVLTSRARAAAWIAAASTPLTVIVSKKLELTFSPA